MEDFNSNDRKYQEAKKQVKAIKGFYIHAAVYILVNLFIVAQNVKGGASAGDIDNYWTAIFWGIGLLAHGIGVYVPNFILGRKWEEQKTRELMDKYK